MIVRPVYTLSRRQVKNLYKEYPVLFGKTTPEDYEDREIYIILPDDPGDTVEVHTAPGVWLGDISFKAAWRL